jgi:hypothetical protein
MNPIVVALGFLSVGDQTALPDKFRLPVGLRTKIVVLYSFATQ